MPTNMKAKLDAGFKQLKVHSADDLKSDETAKALTSLTRCALDALDACAVKPLASTFRAKQYYVLSKDGKLTRPINKLLFAADETRDLLKQFEAFAFDQLTEESQARLLYTMAMAYCAARDVYAEGDRRGTGKYFECLIGHLFARAMEVNPRNCVEVLNLDMNTTLPTDYLFDNGPSKRRLHVPIKLSTRERAIQAWAHQRLLDGVYGTGRFRGILVIETFEKPLASL